MTTFVVPYTREPIRIPRRDLVISAADSLFLSVLVVESDSTAAAPLELTGGDGGPALRMYIWPDNTWRRWDYGAPYATPGVVLWTGLGVVNPDFAGTFDFTADVGTFACVPQRCGFSLQLEWNSATQVQMLAMGTLNVMQGARTNVTPSAVVDDDGDAILVV